MPRLERVRVYAGICLTLSLILISLPSAISAGADQDYVSYTIINELSGRVVDNETGQPIDNVEIWGEVHSRVLKFHIQINGDEYSYELWDNETDEVLVDNEGLSLESGRFVISVSQFLEGEHTYEMRVSAPNHASRSVEGKFVAGEQKNIKIGLEPGGDGDGDFRLNLDSSKATITRSLKKSGGPVAYDVQVKTWTKNEDNSESGVKVNVKEWKLDHTEKTTTWHADVYHREVSHREWIDTSHWGGWEHSSDFRESGRGWIAKQIYSMWPSGWIRVSESEKRRYWKDSSPIYQTRYNYDYVKYTRDWHWFPPGWGSWHPSQNGYESFSSYKGSSFTKGGNFWQNWKKEYSYSGTKRVKVGTRYHWGCRTYTRSWAESGYWDPVYYWNDEGRQSFDSKPSDHGDWDYRNISKDVDSTDVYEWKTVDERTVSESEYDANSGKPDNPNPGQRFYKKTGTSTEGIPVYEWVSDGGGEVSPGVYKSHNTEPDNPSEGDIWYPKEDASPVYERSWVSNPEQVRVGVEIGENSDFEGRVSLSVDSPPEIEAYFGAPNGFEDGVELDLSEDGEISTTLIVEGPESKNDLMLGGFPVTIWATDGEFSKSREFTLNVDAIFDPPYGFESSSSICDKLGGVEDPSITVSESGGTVVINNSIKGFLDSVTGSALFHTQFEPTHSGVVKVRIPINYIYGIDGSNPSTTEGEGGYYVTAKTKLSLTGAKESEKILAKYPRDVITIDIEPVQLTADLLGSLPSKYLKFASTAVTIGDMVHNILSKEDVQEQKILEALKSEYGNQKFSQTTFVKRIPVKKNQDININVGFSVSSTVGGRIQGMKTSDGESVGILIAGIKEIRIDYMGESEQ